MIFYIKIFFFFKNLTIFFLIVELRLCKLFTEFSTFDDMFNIFIFRRTNLTSFNNNLPNKFF
jgi:hypothetical protein